MLIRIVLVFLLFVGVASSVEVAEGGVRVAKVSEEVTGFLKEYCVRCHGPKKQKGKLRFDTMPTMIADAAIAQRWQDILDVLNLSEMPPEDVKQPTKADLSNMLETLTGNLREAKKRLADSGGRVILRRLNRREYRRTIEALFGVPVDVSILPDDGRVDGFDTLGQAHGFSSLHLERYLSIGRKVLDKAYGVGKGRAARGYKKRVETEGASKRIEREIPRLEKKIANATKLIEGGRKQHVERREITRTEVKLSRDYLGREEAQDGVLLPFYGLNLIPHVQVGKKAATGKYRVRVRCGRVGGKASNVVHMRVVRGEFRAKVPDEVFYFQITGTREKPQVVEFTFDVDNIRSDRLAFERRTIAREKLGRFADTRGYFFKYKDVAYLLEDRRPNLWIDWIEVEGPLAGRSGPLSAGELFKGRDLSKLSDKDARSIIERFAYVAFRRSNADAGYVGKLMKVYGEARGHGADVREAMKDVMMVVLASPRFLYLYEPLGEGEKSRRLTDRELAIRLSYFLWSGPPDEALYRVAEAGKLRDAEVLRGQVDRMIASPRADLFIKTFATQWLELDRLDGIDPSATGSKFYDEAVREDSRREVYAFFGTLLRENLAATNMLDSEFAVLNGLMADFYGIAGVRGDRFRKVKLGTGSARGGLLGQSAILTLTGTGKRTSPVERGVFVLRKLLHRPPPPAPANVPMLDEKSVGTRSIRETLSIHMSKAQCSSCHRRIDPLGFSMEHFDPVGLWRESVLSEDGSKRFSIDSSGVMPDGRRKFGSFVEMKGHLAKEREAFMTGLTEAMMTYGLGRTIGFTDQDVVEGIVRETAKKGYRLRELVHRIVGSRPFMTK